MLYSLGEIKSQLAQYAGIKDTNGNYAFDDTTFPTDSLANNIVNDTFREICGGWDYRFLETTKSYQFYHTISGVSALAVSGTSVSGNAMLGQIVPYPSDVLNYTWLGQSPISQSSVGYSGIAFSGVDISGISTSGISNTGRLTEANWTGVGFQYQLDNDVDKLLVPAIAIQHISNGATNIAQGLLCTRIAFEDMMRIFPIGVVAASGAPIYFSEQPGMSPDNNKSIVFGPTPLPSYSGNTFTVFYKKRQEDLINDTDVQNTIPLSWQNVIVKSALVKIYQIKEPDRIQFILPEATQLIRNMKLWDAQQPSLVNKWRDSNYDTNSSFLYDNSSWFTLGEGSR